MNIRQKITVVITDFLLIVEICISMYIASRQPPEDLTPVFIKTFAIMCIPTLIIAKVAIKKLCSPCLPDSDGHIGVASAEK